MSVLSRTKKRISHIQLRFNFKLIKDYHTNIIWKNSIYGSQYYIPKNSPTDIVVALMYCNNMMKVIKCNYYTSKKEFSNSQSSQQQ
jgi:hypothetical protein